MPSGGSAVRDGCGRLHCMACLAFPSDLQGPSQSRPHRRAARTLSAGEPVCAWHSKQLGLPLQGDGPSRGPHTLPAPQASCPLLQTSDGTPTPRDPLSESARSRGSWGVLQVLRLSPLSMTRRRLITPGERPHPLAVGLRARLPQPPRPRIYFRCPHIIVWAFRVRGIIR